MRYSKLSTQSTRIPMALSLARSSSPHPAAAPRVFQPAPPLPFHHSAPHPYPRLRLRVPAAAVAASSAPETAEAEGQGEQEKRRKLYVSNLPWSLPTPEVEKLFAQCGTVKGVEVSAVLCRTTQCHASVRAVHSEGGIYEKSNACMP
jgi:hypothetical protein